MNIKIFVDDVTKVVIKNRCNVFTTTFQKK